MVQRLHGLDEAESNVWVALTVFSQLFTPAMDARLREAELTLFEYGALMSLSDVPDRSLRISEMAARTYAPVPRMSKVVARLQSRGLVERSASASDRRAAEISLTAAGRRRLLAAATLQAEAARELVLNRISADDARRLAGILTPLVNSLDPGNPLASAH